MDLLGIGREGPWREGIDGDAVRPHLPRQRSCEADDASLGGDIIEQERHPAEKGDRGDVNDPAATGCFQGGVGGASAEVVALQVGVLIANEDSRVKTTSTSSPSSGSSQADKSKAHSIVHRGTVP